MDKETQTARIAEISRAALKLAPTDLKSCLIVWVEAIPGVFTTHMFYIDEQQTIRNILPAWELDRLVLDFWNQGRTPENMNSWNELTIEINPNGRLDFDFHAADPVPSPESYMSSRRSIEIARKYFGNRPLQLVGMPTQIALE